MNKNILNHARAMVFDSDLHKEMWGEAVMTSVHMINRSFTTAVSKLPAEIWYSQRQDLSHIKIFGNRVSVKILSYLKKRDSRARAGIFVGYGENCYRIWDPEEREVFMGRDVKFHTQVEFHSHPQKDTVDLQNQNFIHMCGKETEHIQSQNQEITQNEETTKDKSQHGPKRNRNIPLKQYHQRAAREKRAPSKFKDFQLYLCQAQDSSLKYEECINQKEWKLAIEDEKRSIVKNNTWTLVDKTEALGEEIIDSRWVLKYKENGKPKARLVAKGYQQRKDNLNYQGTYSPVVDTSNLRVLLALAARSSLNIKTFDVKTAFLNGNLEDKVYENTSRISQSRRKNMLVKKGIIWFEPGATKVV